MPRLLIRDFYTNPVRTRLIRFSTYTRHIAIIVVSMLLSAQLSPALALACEGASEEFAGGNLVVTRFKKGGVVDKCLFEMINEKCGIEYEEKGTGEYEIEKAELLGAQFAIRYKIVAGATCTVGKKKFKKPEKCKDEIERTNNEAGQNEFCVTFKTEPGGLEIPSCTKLEV